MEELVVLGLVGLTSLGAAVMAGRALGLSAKGLTVGLGAMLESVGAGLIFFAANLGAAAVIILTARLLGWGHPSLYLGNDLALLALSLLQGLTFQSARRCSQAGGADRWQGADGR